MTDFDIKTDEKIKHQKDKKKLVVVKQEEKNVEVEKEVNAADVALQVEEIVTVDNISQVKDNVKKLKDGMNSSIVQAPIVEAIEEKVAKLPIVSCLQVKEETGYRENLF